MRFNSEFSRKTLFANYLDLRNYKSDRYHEMLIKHHSTCYF